MGEALNVFLRHSEGLGSTSFFAFLLTVLVLLGLWAGLGQLPLADIFKGPSARQLFLTVPMHVSAAKAQPEVTPRKAAGPRDFSGFVTALSTDKLTFISPRSLPRGEKITIDLRVLPDFPEAGGGYPVVVTRSRSITRKADSFLVDAAFDGLGDEQKAPLLSYLQRLNGPSRLALG
jgi:hypothetical protein